MVSSSSAVLKVSATVATAAASLQLGLSETSHGVSGLQVEYGVRLEPSGRVWIAGAASDVASNYSVGDTVAVALEGGHLVAYLNDVQVPDSQPTTPHQCRQLHALLGS